MVAHAFSDAAPTGRKRSLAESSLLLPRFIRLRDAPSYLGMDRNRFIRDVRPLLDAIPIGSQGIAFDRLDLDSWADDYTSRNGHPAVCESTGTGDIGQAKEYLAKRVIELRETRLYGTRELRSFRSAATKYLQDYNHKKRIKDDALQLKQLDPFIGSLELKQVHMGSLQDFIAKRRQDGVKTKTLNMALAVVRRVLNLASSEWMDRQGKTWLGAAPKIKLFPVKDARSPYPLTREEQGLEQESR
jgi:hypothetical protein